MIIKLCQNITHSQYSLHTLTVIHNFTLFCEIALESHHLVIQNKDNLVLFITPDLKICCFQSPKPYFIVHILSFSLISDFTNSYAYVL